MKTFFVGSFLALALLVSGAPHVQAQSCSDAGDCVGSQVCCPLPPTGSVKECRSQNACASVNPSQPAGGDANPLGIFDNPLKAESLMDLLLSVLRGIVRIAGIFLVLAFVFIGFQFAAAQGNTEAISKARSNLLWTAIGAAILLGAEGIAAIIESTARSLTP